jgi:malate dehydrogenase
MQYNHVGTRVGAPVKLGKNGVEQIIEVALNDDELQLLHDSVNSVNGIMDVLDGMNILYATDKINN